MKAIPRPISLYPYVCEPSVCQPTPSYTPPSWPTRKLRSGKGKGENYSGENWLHSLLESSIHPFIHLLLLLLPLLYSYRMCQCEQRQKGKRKKKKIVPEPKEWRQTVSSNDESSISPLPHGYTSNENWFVFWSCWPLISWCFLFPGSPPLRLWSHPFSLLTQHILPGQPSSLIIPIVVVF